MSSLALLSLGSNIEPAAYLTAAARDLRGIMPDTSIAAPVPPPEAGTRPAFDNSYARLPERLFARLAPTAVSAPRLLRLNTGLAEALDVWEKALRVEAEAEHAYRRAEDEYERAVLATGAARDADLIRESPARAASGTAAAASSPDPSFG